MKVKLSPTLEDVKLECVLVQAWKKASSYIRYHNWYADTLGLDYQSLRLPQFVKELQAKLEHGWETTPLKVVPAPKSQKWAIGKDNSWKQKQGEDISNKLRPLAHVSLEDQVISTAIMLCLADHVEMLQGNPETDITSAKSRKKVISYGNRLFCDYDSEGNARHRWGSATLYRKYFTDYQTFLKRPEIVDRELRQSYNDAEIAIVHCDLSKFYDRVRPDKLQEKIKKHAPQRTKKDLLGLATSVFNWTWHDSEWANTYAEKNEIGDFKRIALPQGLVSSGFFANIFLIDFDESLKNSFAQAINDSVTLIDACRYVDDLRLVLTAPKGANEQDVQKHVSNWLQTQLNDHAPGLKIEPSKTKVIIEGREERFLVPMSHNARRIQHDISGTLDMLHGTELIGAIEGFFYTQKRYSHEQSQANGHGLLVGMSDMRDDTASRFAAGKFRRTFRSLRPLLDDEEGESGLQRTTKLILSKQQLDERGKLFSAMLIEEWVTNPANVRLLRVALDIYPDKDFLDKVLKIIADGWQVGGCKTQRKEVKLYCLSEIFRAGATETGLAPSDECLPEGINIADYHGRLIEEGKKILNSGSIKNRDRCPWYLMQQIYLYLVARNEVTDISIPPKSSSDGLSLYYQFAKFLRGKPEVDIDKRSAFTALAVQAFGQDQVMKEQRLSSEFLKHLTTNSPKVAIQLYEACRTSMSNSVTQAAKQMGLDITPSSETTAYLPEIASREQNPFWNEANLLKLAADIAEQMSDELLNPWQIECEFEDLENLGGNQLPTLKNVSVSKKSKKATELFEPPSWAESDDDKKRFSMGMILRFALRGSIDFYINKIFRKHKSQIRYSKPSSHWLQLHHGGYHGRTAFAPEWVALSSWMDDFLFELFRWPGCGNYEPLTWEKILELLKERSNEVCGKLKGSSTGLLFLEQRAPEPWGQQNNWSRIMRVGVVQSVIPTPDDFVTHLNNPQLNSKDIRKRHKQHLSALMAGINQMLYVRNTHKNDSNACQAPLDILVFPELAIHPDDVDSMLVPFVRKHRCIILAGLVYHLQGAGLGGSLINTALWVVPEFNKMQGLQIKKIEQGKFHITKEEERLSPAPIPFRPAQWIVRYDWASNQSRPLYLSASICYDSTDIALCSDLRPRTDIFSICALNKDVGTFDRMAESSHYHMFQGLIVSNNGQFGGSSCYMPFSKPENRQVLHLHGQPQAQIAFIEIDPEKMINRPNSDERKEPVGKWKTPPAGWTKID